MKTPNLKEEKKLWKKGYKWVVGLDEAGRGSLAGPVVAAAVLINSKFKIQNLKIKDSKKLTPKKREEFYNILTKHPSIGWGIGRVSEKVIDKINILEATKLAMKKAIKNLTKKLKNEKTKKQKYLKRTIVRIKEQNLFLIIDGNFNLNSDGRFRIPRARTERGRGLRFSDAIPQKSIIKADEKVFSCCIASVIAKVTRDRIMKRYHKKYPQYRFAKHKGYPTKYHLKMLKKYGPSVIHRLTFKPVKDII